MTSEEEMIEEWKRNHMTFWCERNRIWMSKEACLLRQQTWGTEIKKGRNADDLMSSPKILTCKGCEYMVTPLRRISIHERVKQ
jgi:hypothetical protein